MPWLWQEIYGEVTKVKMCMEENTAYDIRKTKIILKIYSGIEEIKNYNKKEQMMIMNIN